MSQQEYNLSSLTTQLEADGLPVAETLMSLFTISPVVFEAGGSIGDEYCWMHHPGGWSCPVCCAEQLRREITDE